MALFPNTLRFPEHSQSQDVTSGQSATGTEAAPVVPASSESDTTSSQSKLQKESFLQLIHDQLQFLVTESQDSFSDSSSKLEIAQIPAHLYDLTKPLDPICFVEEKADEGKQYGAVKLSLDSLHEVLSQGYLHLDIDEFSFKPTTLRKCTDDELQERLAFCRDLSMLQRKLHTISKGEAESLQLGTVPVVPTESSELPLDTMPTELGIVPKAELENISFEPVEPGVKQESLSVLAASNDLDVAAHDDHLNDTHTAANNSEEQKLSEQLKQESPNPTSDFAQIPPVWEGIPKINGQSIDLYLLYHLVLDRQGYKAVVSKRLWGEIALELKISDLTGENLASLEQLYCKILYPLEQIQTSHSKTEEPESNLLDDNLTPSSKRRKLEAKASIPTSFQEYKRSARAKASKGILLNSPHLFKSKRPLPVSTSQAPNGTSKGTDETTYTTTLEAQLENYLNWLATYMATFDDALSSESPSDVFCSLRKIIDQDSRTRNTILRSIEHIASLSSESPKISTSELERFLWSNFAELSHHSDFGNKGRMIPFSQNSIGSLRTNDSFITSKSKVHKLGNSNGSHGPTQSRTLEHDMAQSSIHPFNLHNLPFLPDSLLAALSDTDLDSAHLTSVSLDVATTLSIENWNCADHFTQVCHWHVAGAWKRWYFIPELEFEKMEALILGPSGVNARTDSTEISQENINELAKDSQSIVLQEDILTNVLGNCPYEIPTVRLPLEQAKFQGIIDSKMQNISHELNHNVLLTPEVLQKHGIRYTTTIQKPGEVIYQYPKTFSCSISYGVSIAERVGFASKLWLKYGLEAQNWLAKQSLLPNFLVFKQFFNIAQQLDSSHHSALHLSPAVYSEVLPLFTTMVDEELELRQSVKKRFKAREITLEDKESDVLSDVDFQPLFPTKVLIKSSANTNIIMSLQNLQLYLDLKGLGEKLPEILSQQDVKVELHLFCSDEKLRTFRRLLQEYSIDYKAWQRKYNETITSEEDMTLRTYKSLLAEGQKISAAILGISKTYVKFTSNKSASETLLKIEEFRNQLSDLQDFIDESNEIVEQCQAILALKHQQRIRNGAAEQPAQESKDTGASLTLLVELCNRIPKLNFFAPEFEQVFEYRNEIESFDRACRQLLGQESVSMADVKDMVSLGASFGMKIPSLEFLNRVKDRLEWIQTYETIISGGDPFIGKKDIFLLLDLEKFRDTGLECLSSADVQKLKNIDEYVAKGHALDKSVQEFINLFYVINDVDLQKLDEIMADMEERVKLSGKERLFVHLETYLKLLDLKSHESKIQFLQSFNSQKHNLHDVKQMLSELLSIDLGVRTNVIRGAIAASEDWVNLAAAFLQMIKVRKLNSSTPSNLKQAAQPKLVAKIRSLIEDCRITFTDLSVDSVEKSSPYAFYKGSESSLEAPFTVRYCLCRDFEEGDMIECDRCHEWFHFGCVSHLSQISDSEDAKYTCPACIILENYKLTHLPSMFPDRIPELQLLRLIIDGERLHVTPVVELELLKELAEQLSIFKSWAFGATQQMVGIDAVIADQLMLRKIVGAPVTIEPLVEQCLHKVATTVGAVPTHQVPTYNEPRATGNDQIDPEMSSLGVTAETPIITSPPKLPTQALPVSEPTSVVDTQANVSSPHPPVPREIPVSQPSEVRTEDNKATAVGVASTREHDEDITVSEESTMETTHHDQTEQETPIPSTTNLLPASLENVQDSSIEASVPGQVPEKKEHIDPDPIRIKSAESRALSAQAEPIVPIEEGPVVLSNQPMQSNTSHETGATELKEHEQVLGSSKQFIDNISAPATEEPGSQVTPSTTDK
ncbi:hypothetical protein PUMCH_002880 [Australozyma saopauloensis]|uniref:Uncharacterized protein n=1 Tax=Australozyma saopauloensis TaxID=291208 RepID=A0AAX4HCZ5_9ASCO|nr:hypothetical protein PUMCH_002880 [[Candida] saopauloensis]